VRSVFAILHVTSIMGSGLMSGTERSLYAEVSSMFQIESNAHMTCNCCLISKKEKSLYNV